MQEDCLSFIEERLISDSGASIVEVLRDTKQAFNVPMRTLRRWYKHFSEFGEYPFETKRRERIIRRQMKRYKVTKVVTDNVIAAVKTIVDEHPEFYLDEIQSSLCVSARVFLSLTLINCILKEKLGYFFH